MRHVSTLCLALVLAATPGCALRARSVATRYYTLAVTPVASDAPVFDGLHRVIGLGPVTLPEYLDRPQLVARASEAEVTFRDDVRWGEPLIDGFFRVLAFDVSLYAGGARVLPYPWAANAPVDVAVVVHVVRFERLPAGDVALDARIAVAPGPRSPHRIGRDLTLREPVDGPAAEATVAAMSRALDGLAREVAAEVRRVAP